MNEEIQPTEEQKAKQAGRDVADVAARAASTYYGGAIGNKVYDMASRTKTGQQMLNNAGNSLSKNPILRNQNVQNAISNSKPVLDQAANLAGGQTNLETASSDIPDTSSNNSSSLFKSLFNNSKSDGNDNGFSIKKTKFYIKLIPPVAMLFLMLFFILIVVAMVMSGFEYVNTTVSTTGDKLWNFLSGCGWSTNQECADKRANDFYEEIEKQYNKYKSEYGIEINKNLLVATLTYNNPFITATTTDELGSTTVDFKKGRKHVKDLVKNMLDEYEICYLIKDGNRQEVNCETEKYDTKEVYYKLNEEKYRKYLEDTFILKYYLDNELTEKNRDKALKITEEIYNRVELYDYLKGNGTVSKSIAANNTMVTLTDCHGIAVEQMTLYDYLQGVVYMHYDGSSEEYLKYVAMVAKNYLYSINNASIDNMSQTLRVQNCGDGQLSCSATKGCHYISFNNKNENLESGADDENNYYKLPVSDAIVYANIKKAVDETISEFIIKDGKIVYPENWYLNKTEIMSLLNTSDYKTVLTQKFGGNIDSINLFAVGYPLDLKWINVTSGYGWRIHPILKTCKYHSGTDIAASEYSNIYSIADGVVTKSVTNYGLTGYGNYVEIGHGQKINGNYEYYSLYAHQVISPPVQVGDKVKAGELIGFVGNTGRSNGNHLHIEIYKYINGQKVSQDAVLTFKNVQLTGVLGPMFASEAQCEANR